ncbi:hypothetical protein R3P38DRAFT_3236555 [Favolaschia claudopus]|uniref:F-box domain-containing protein n=1 Tax=Favolaschia claudopus TaxID=2862362 RepID=A0AAV9ZCM7_9AGAR
MSDLDPNTSLSVSIVNPMHPCWLPIEIWGFILLLACGPFEIRQRSLSTRYASLRLVYQLICKHWFELIRAEAEFWDGLFVNEDTEEAEILLTAHRAKTRAIHLVVDGEPSSRVSLPFRFILKTLLPALEATSNQYGRMTFRTDCASTCADIMHWLQRTPSASVKRVDFEFGPSIPRTLGPLPNFLDASSLTTMDMMGAIIVLPSQSLRSITHLRLRAFNVFNLTRWRMLRDMLRQCVALTHLVLEMVHVTNLAIFSDPRETVCLVPKLQHLEIGASRLATACLLKALRVPSLKIFVIHCSGSVEPDFLEGGPDDIGVHIDNETLASVEVLEIHVPEPDHRSLKQLIGLFPRLEVLDLRGAGQYTVASVQEMGLLLSQPLCSNLSRILFGEPISLKMAREILLRRPDRYMLPGCVLSFEYEDREIFVDEHGSTRGRKVVRRGSYRQRGESVEDIAFLLRPLAELRF